MRAWDAERGIQPPFNLEIQVEATHEREPGTVICYTTGNGTPELR
jgi:hypothetical protein